MSGVAFAQADIEQCFVNRTNAERAERGLGTMAVNQDLVTMARRHSRRMADAGTIYHNPDLSAEGPRGWKLLGENVGVGPVCDSLHVAFMNSPHHRENILEPRFNYVGMGVVLAGDSTIYITEQFMQAGAAPRPPSPAPAPAPPPSPRPSPVPESPRPASPRPGSPRPAPAPSPQPSAPPAPAPSPQPSPPPSPAATRSATPAATAPSAPGPSPVVLGGLTLAVLAGAALAWAATRRRRS